MTDSIAIFGLVVPLESLLPILVTTLVFVVLGLLVFALTFLVIAKATPLRKEIEEDHNVALAIVVASVILGSALIIAAAVHG